MSTMTRREIERAYLARRELKVRRARQTLWDYCQTDSPDFYKQGAWHLELFCWVLQALFDRRLTKENYTEAAERIAPAWFLETASYLDNVAALEAGRLYKSLIVNLPP